MPLADQHPRRRGFLFLRQHADRRPALLRGPHPARLPAGLSPARRAGVSDYLRSQVALAYAARASRAFALSLTSSLRASAMRITIFSFPLARNLSRNAPRLWS